MPMLRAIFPDGIAPVGRTNDDERELLNIRWGMPGPQFGGGAITTIRNTKSAHWRRWLNPASRWAAPRKPNPATLSELAAGATARLQLLYPPRLRRDLAAISGPRASLLLRCGRLPPYIVLLGSLAVRMVQATLVSAIAAAVQVASPALLSAEESGRPALMIEIDGAIGPATARYVKEALPTAAGKPAEPALLPIRQP